MKMLKKCLAFVIILCISSQLFSSDMLSIAGLDKKKVLQALFKASVLKRPDNCFAYEAESFGYDAAPPLSDEDAESALLKQNYNREYLLGRAIKIDFSKDVINTYLFNRENGKQAAQKAILTLKKAK